MNLIGGGSPTNYKLKRKEEKRKGMGGPGG